MKARTLVTAAMLVVAACGGEGSVTGEGPVATTPSTVAPVPPATAPATTTPAVTTTTAPFAWSPEAAQALYDEIAEFNGWSIPAVALPDYAADACGRGVWDPVQAFAFGEVLLADNDLDLRKLSHDHGIRTRVARMGWALAAVHCSDRFPPEALAAGPPTSDQHPACDRLSWRPHLLPWTDGVGPADRVVLADDGSLELTWVGPTGERLSVTFGRDAAWERAVSEGQEIADFGAAELGPLRRGGWPAHVVVTGDTLSVAWDDGPEFCTGIVATISPPPPDDPLDRLAGYLFEPLDARINDAELRMWSATRELRGFDHIGGEPSHGGLDAVHWMEDEAGTGYFLYAIPVERFPSLRRDGTWTPAGSDEAAGHPVRLFVPPSGELTARTVVDGFVLEATADLAADDLVGFMATWIGAWQAAG